MCACPCLPVWFVCVLSAFTSISNLVQQCLIIESHKGPCECLFYFLFITASVRLWEHVWALCSQCSLDQSSLILTARHFSSHGLNPKTGTYSDMLHACVCEHVCPSLVYSFQRVLFSLHGQKVLERVSEIWRPKNTRAQTHTCTHSHIRVCLWKRAVSAALTHHSSLATNSVRPLSSLSHPTLLSENSIRG